MTPGSTVPRLSVVIATYNRPVLVERLLRQLAAQTLPRQEFEVVVVDDGSAPPVREAIDALALPLTLRTHAQANAGAAAARDAGVRLAMGELVVFVDDDMQVRPDFLAQHLSAHAGAEPSVVLGRIAADPALERMPLFERWHQSILDRNAEDFAQGRVKVQGNHLFTGNVSLPRAAYLAVEGFDRTLGHSEDVELGLRLEQAGLTFRFAPAAVTLHGSDHTKLLFWRKRAFKYGGFDHRVAQKHPTARHANPWRFAFDLSTLTRPFVAAAVLTPGLAEPIATAALVSARAFDRLGLEKAALRGTTLAYALEYFRGLRTAAGPLGSALGELLTYLARHEGGNSAIWARLWADLAEDQRTLQLYEAKYGHPAPSQGALAGDVVQKVGLQLMACYRLMRALRQSGNILGARIVSRLIRYTYGSDLHWDAEFAPGVMLVHGMGLCISHAARVSTGCILFQHVTLGMGTDPMTRALGAPRLEPDVHVGPGATLIGPITIGAGAKIMAGAVVTESVPAGAVVETARPLIRSRKSKHPAAPNEVNEVIGSSAESVGSIAP